MLPDRETSESFSVFVREIELRLRQALTAAYGPEIGREASAEALVYGWEHWDRVSVMDNAVGYLYRVGQSRAGRMRKGVPAALPPIDSSRLPWVEPGLPAAMQRLSEKQRTVVLLLYAYEWSMSEVGELLGISKATVQSHSSRALRRLRRKLGVDR